MKKWRMISEGEGSGGGGVHHPQVVSIGPDAKEVHEAKRNGHQGPTVASSSPTVKSYSRLALSSCLSWGYGLTFNKARKERLIMQSHVLTTRLYRSHLPSCQLASWMPFLNFCSLLPLFWAILHLFIPTIICKLAQKPNYSSKNLIKNLLFRT